MSEKEISMTAERFAELIADAKWMTIDQMVDRLDRASYWDDESLAHAQSHFKKAHVRKMAKRLKSDGHRVFASIVINDAKGNQVRVYKQEMLFTLSDYRQVVNYHKQVGLHHIQEANAYADRGTVRFGKQIPLPFPSFVEADNA